MKNTLLFLAIALACSACGGKPSVSNAPAASNANAAKTPSIPKDGNYTGLGKVTKINAAGGSIEIDHEEIPDLMPRMIMEFNVKDKAMLKGLSVGDSVKFIIEYKHPAETIILIEKK